MAARHTVISPQNVEAENRQLVDALRALHSQYHTLKSHTNKQLALLQSGGEELQETTQHLASLQKELASTREELERVNGGKIERDTPKNGIFSRNLEPHDDGRKNKKAKSKYRLADYRDAIAGMEQEIMDRKAAAAELERNNADLSLRIVDLERRCAELDGRRAERENLNAEPRAALDNRNEEQERLSKNMSRMQKEFTKLNIGMQTGQSRLDSGNDMIASPDTDIAASAIDIRKERNLSADLDRQANTGWPTEPIVLHKEKEIREVISNEELYGASWPERFLIVPIGHDVPRTKYPLNKNEITIGRSRDNDITIPDKCISRVHARVILEGLQVLIEDMGSKNGIKVNSEPKQRHELKHGDRFSIGSTAFRLLDLGIRANAVSATLPS